MRGEFPGNADGRPDGSEPARRAIGRWLRRQRRVLGMSQEEFRRALRREGVEVSQATVSRWERGAAAPPGEILPLVARVLHGTLAELDELVREARAEAGAPSGEGTGTGTSITEVALAAARAAAMDYRARALRLMAEVESRLAREAARLDRERYAGALLWLAEAAIRLGRLEEARRVLARVGPGEDLSPRVRARLLTARCGVARWARDRALVEELAAEYSAAKEGLAPLDRAWCSHMVGLACYGTDVEQMAVELLEDAVAVWESLEEWREVARSRASLALALACAGRPGDGVVEAERCLALTREWGFREVEVDGLEALGRALAALGEVDRAVHVFDEGAAYARAIGLPKMEFFCRFYAWKALVRARRREEALEAARLVREVLPNVPAWYREVKEFLGVSDSPKSSGKLEEDGC